MLTAGVLSLWWTGQLSRLRCPGVPESGQEVKGEQMTVFFPGTWSKIYWNSLCDTEGTMRRPPVTGTQLSDHRIQEVSGQTGIRNHFQVSYTFSIPLGIEELGKSAAWDLNSSYYLWTLLKTCDSTMWLHHGDKTILLWSPCSASMVCTQTIYLSHNYQQKDYTSTCSMFFLLPQNTDFLFLSRWPKEC